MERRFIDTQQTLSRGPTIIILSLITLVLPHVLSLSLVTLLLLASTLIGLLITIMDVSIIFQSTLAQWKISIKKCGDNLVLDDLLKDIFGAEGLLSCGAGAMAGTFALYFLPLSKEFRLRIFRQAWVWVVGNEEDQGDFVHRVLFQPGGLWKINPDLLPGGGSHEDDEMGMDVDLVTAEKARAGHECDMTWDDVDSETTTHRESHEEDSVQTADFDKNVRVAIRNAAAATSMVKEGLEETKTTRRPSSGVDHVDHDTFEQIIIDAIRQMSKLAVDQSSVSEIQLRRIGIGAVIMLGIQMKKSRAARRMLWDISQGAGACSLACMAIGAFMSAQLKTKAVQFAYGEETHSNPPVPHSAHFWDLGRATGEGRRNGIGSFIEMIPRRFRNDETLKKRFKSVLAIIVVYCFRRKVWDRARILPRR